MDFEVYLQPFKLSVVMLKLLCINPLFAYFQWLNGLSIGLWSTINVRPHFLKIT